MRMIWFSLTLAVAVVANMGCVSWPLMGDPGYSVTVENGSSAPVTFFVDGVGAQPGSGKADGTTLAPGSGHVDHWLIPSDSKDPRRATIRAVGPAGGVVYCRRFAYDELASLRFHIRIADGVNDCS